MKKAISIALAIIAFIFILLNVFSINNKSLFGFRIYKVGSGSMEPTIHVNSLILIKESNNYKEKDIVTYYDNNSYVTHRIVSVDKDTIITKGDANNTEDKPINKKQVVGKLIYQFTIITFLVFMLAKPITWVLIVLLSIIVYLIIKNKKI